MILEKKIYGLHFCFVEAVVHSPLNPALPSLSSITFLKTFCSPLSSYCRDHTKGHVG